MPSTALLLRRRLPLLGLLLCGAGVAGSTDWDSLSPLLEGHWASSLPPIPAVGLDMAGFAFDPVTGPFQRVAANLSSGTVGLCQAEPGGAGDVWPAGAVTAGPRHDCDAPGSHCSSGVTSGTCRAASVHNNREDIVALAAKPGGYSSKFDSQPAWIQLRFPKPAEAASAEFRFELDERYPPTTAGGNPCHRAPGANCTLCTTHLNGGPWDFGVPPGVRLLWSFPSAAAHTIDPEPVDAFAAWSSGQTDLHRQSPPGLDLRGQIEVVVTIMGFNQYAPYTNSLEDSANYDMGDPTRCTTDWNKNESIDPRWAGNVLISLRSASLVTRSFWDPAHSPPVTRPRLFGSDTEWVATDLAPFYDQDCVRSDSWNPGWGGDAGVPDFKGRFEKATLGYATCLAVRASDSDQIPASIMEHDSVDGSYARWNGTLDSGNPTDFNSSTSATTRNLALGVFHLLRRMRYCHTQDPTGASCQFSSTEVAELVGIVIARERATFDVGSRERNDDHSAWGWEQDTDGCCGYDLFTAATMKHFSVFLDVLGDEVLARDPTFYQELSGKMRSYAVDFVASFSEGAWNLWNGNNWTPVLCEGAMYWAITFWHEDYALAREVVHIINDISLIHLGMWLPEGMYKEGNCQYAVMSTRSSIALGVLYARAFRETWGSIDADRLARGAQWQLDTYDTAGYAIDFGDSHACRGTTTVTLYAAYAAEIVAPVDSPVASTVDPCLIREWSALAYWLTVGDPWQFYAVLANDLTGLQAQCDPETGGMHAHAGIHPLGPGRFEVYDTAYGAIKSPLFDACSEEDAVRWGCSNATTLSDPRLKDVFLYSNLALQARPNEFPHSEIDFGTFKWAAWGQHLISELGYGYIGEANGRYDGRRYGQIDNNPSGHNTLIIREAYPEGDDEINFSQLNYVVGTITKTLGLGLSCMHLDGGDVYGASRENGWFQYMHRWVCEIGTGHFLIVDSFATQADRQPLNIYGAQYGGPSFNELNRSCSGGDPDAQSQLTVDEYFHTASWLQGTDIAGLTQAELAFDRALAPSRCSHADIEITGDTDTQAVLRSRCGEDGSEGNAVGEITGWSRAGGRFVNDGLVSGQDRWGRSILHMNRMHFEGSGTVGPDGDVRVFLLTSSVAPEMPPPSWIVGSPTTANNGTPGVVCLGTEQYTVSVSADGGTLTADRAGHCDGEVVPSTTSPSPDPTPSAGPGPRPTLAPALSCPTSSPSATGIHAPESRPTAAPNQAPDSDLDANSSGSSSSSSSGAIAGVVFAVVIAGLIGLFVFKRHRSAKSERSHSRPAEFHNEAYDQGVF